MKPYPLASLNHFTFPLAIRLPPAGESSPATHRCGLRGGNLRALYRASPIFCQENSLQECRMWVRHRHMRFAFTATFGCLDTSVLACLLLSWTLGSRRATGKLGRAYARRLHAR